MAVDSADHEANESPTAQAAFGAWYTQMSGDKFGSEDAWRSLGVEFKHMWNLVAESVITVYEDPENLGPIARDMDNEELDKLRCELAALFAKENLQVLQAMQAAYERGLADGGA
jgi:hypothetical protein